jgi:hypothetical protein
MYETSEMHKGIWFQSLRETDMLEIQRVDGKIILKCIMKALDGRDLTRLIGLL